MALPEPTLYRIFNRPGRPVCLAELAGAKTPSPSFRCPGCGECLKFHSYLRIRTLLPD